MKNVLAIIVIVGLAAMFIAAEVIARNKKREKMKEILKVGRRIVVYDYMPFFEECNYLGSGTITSCGDRKFTYVMGDDSKHTERYASFGKTIYTVEVYDGDKLVYTNNSAKK